MAAKRKPQHLLDIEAVITTPHGARFIWRILEKAGVHRTCFDPDSAVMAMLEGQRNIGLMVLGDIMRACPEKYINLLASRNARREKDNEETTHVVEPDFDYAADAAGSGVGEC